MKESTIFIKLSAKISNLTLKKKKIIKKNLF